MHAHALEIADSLLLGVGVSLGRGRAGEINFPVGLAKESLPESTELLAGIIGISVSPVVVSGLDVEDIFERALLEVLFDQILSTFLAPESCPPVLELATDDSELSDLTAFLHGVRAKFHGVLEVFLPALLVVMGEILDSLVPLDGQLVIIGHALVELVAHVHIESGEDEARIEVSDFVSLVGEESKEFHSMV